MLAQKTKSSPTVAAIHPVPDVLSKREGRFFAASFMERIKEFTKVLEAPANSDGDEESRLKWLASQVVGANANMVTPFGRRRITYCDHTASGRFPRPPSLSHSPSLPLSLLPSLALPRSLPLSPALPPSLSLSRSPSLSSPSPRDRIR